jgi:hypothetical protein
MKAHLKIAADLLEKVRRDLLRPHPFAAERVGFLAARCTRSHKAIIMIPTAYYPVPDEGYVPDASVGAMMNEQTILSAMQLAYAEKVSIIHVHLHAHNGRPGQSATDRRESAKFVPAFANVRPEYPHAAVILSYDSMSGYCWLPGGRKPVPISTFTLVGPHVRKISI